MTDPLAESWAKIIRAKEHTDALNAEVALWLQEMEAKGDMIRTRYEFDQETGWCEGFIDNVPEPPPYRFGLIVGDVVHNLRSALDHLAWELANITKPNRGEDRVTQFPITLSPDEFASTRVQRMMRHMDTEHRELIEQEQPYVTGGSSPESHPLAWLADLSNRDKHQGIHPVSVDAEAYYAYPVPISDCRVEDQTVYGVDVKPDAKIMRMRFVATGPNPQVAVQPSIQPPTVSLRSGTSIGRTDYVLPNLSAHVLNTIRKFEHFFQGA